METSVANSANFIANTARRNFEEDNRFGDTGISKKIKTATKQALVFINTEVWSMLSVTKCILWANTQNTRNESYNFITAEVGGIPGKNRASWICTSDPGV